MATQQNNTYASPLRYPGGKGNLANFMKLIISENDLLDGHYVELYAGGAGIAWKLLFEEYVQKVHINDLNRPLMAFWNSVLQETDELCRLIADTPVNVDEWQKQRSIQANPDNHSQLEVGFSTFFLNRTNRSGILNGGIIGGKNQTGEWKIDARYNKEGLINRIQQIARYSSRISLYNLDAAVFIKKILPKLPQKTLVYLDPPYFNKGQELYENHYTESDHKKISELVSSIEQPWLVSYDGCQEIKDLYKDYASIDYFINYSAQARYAGPEVIFFSKKLVVPQVSSPTKIKLSEYMKPLL